MVSGHLLATPPSRPPPISSTKQCTQTCRTKRRRICALCSEKLYSLWIAIERFLQLPSPTQTTFELQNYANADFSCVLSMVEHFSLFSLIFLSLSIRFSSSALFAVLFFSLFVLAFFIFNNHFYKLVLSVFFVVYSFNINSTVKNPHINTRPFTTTVQSSSLWWWWSFVVVVVVVVRLFSGVLCSSNDQMVMYYCPVFGFW